mgnify:CR=1 FL=1
MILKKKIIHIANELNLGDITTDEAKEELLFLFGVSRSTSEFCTHCVPYEIDITRCPKCGSSDHTINHSGAETCLNCGNKF